MREQLELSAVEVEMFVDAADAVGVGIMSYSGRGMFGATCLCVVLTASQIGPSVTMRLTIELAARSASLADIIANAKAETDQLGLGSVLYWPGIAAIEDDDDSDE